MGDNRTYIPTTHCAVCVHLGIYTASTSSVFVDGRSYLGCDQHAGEIVRFGINNAVKHAKPPTTPKGNNT